MTAKFFVFVFAYFRRIPSIEQLRTDPKCYEQGRAIQDMMTAGGLKHTDGQMITAYALDRHAAFIDDPRFRQAVDSARASDADLFLTLPSLIRISPKNRWEEIVERIRKEPVRILDCGSARYCHEMTQTQYALMLRGLKAQSNGRSIAIKAGLARSDKPRSAVPSRVREKGNAVRSRLADRNASRHRDFIMDLIAQKPEGEQVSPAEVARALNEAGRLSPRGKPWSYNSAKITLKRLGLAGTDGANPEMTE